MKALLTACCLALLCGCATINNRVVDNHVMEPYSCTCEAVAMCSFIMFPQIMSPGPSQLYWLNLVSVPVGACCFIVDVPLEAVCDTICYPFDKHRLNQKENSNDE